MTIAGLNELYTAPGEKLLQLQHGVLARAPELCSIDRVSVNTGLLFNRFVCEPKAVFCHPEERYVHQSFDRCTVMVFQTQLMLPPCYTCGKGARQPLWHFTSHDLTFDPPATGFRPSLSAAGWGGRDSRVVSELGRPGVG